MYSLPHTQTKYSAVYLKEELFVSNHIAVHLFQPSGQREIYGRKTGEFYCSGPISARPSLLGSNPLPSPSQLSVPTMAVPSIFSNPLNNPSYLLLPMTLLITHRWFSLNSLQSHFKPNYSQKSASPFLSLWREGHTFTSLIFLDSSSSHHPWEHAFPLVYDFFFFYYYCSHHLMLK